MATRSAFASTRDGAAGWTGVRDGALAATYLRGSPGPILAGETGMACATKLGFEVSEDAE